MIPVRQKGGAVMKQSVNSWKKRLLPTRVVIVLTVLTTAATSTLLFAKYLHVSSPQEDVFVPQNYDTPQIAGTFDKNTEALFSDSNVTVTPDASVDYPVYVRVAIVLTWQDEDGNVFGQQPVLGKDYQLTFNTDQWFRHTDGYYYCRIPVKGGARTPALIREDQKLVQLRQAPDDESVFHVEYLAETVQALGVAATGEQAVLDAWGVLPAAD